MVMSGACLMLAGLTGCSELLPEKPGGTKSGPHGRKPVAGYETPPWATGSIVLKEATKDYVAAFSYPAEVTALPALDAQFQREFERFKARAKVTAEETRPAAASAGITDPVCTERHWWLAGVTARWVSLAGMSRWFVPGMAHPNSSFEQHLWDRRLARARPITDLFVSKTMLSASIRSDFCSELNRQRAERRDDGGAFDPDGYECIDPADYPVVPSSSNGAHFDYLLILVPAYAAGPYAEGQYVIHVPVRPALLKAIRSEHRPEFLPLRDGATLGHPLEHANSECAL